MSCKANLEQKKRLGEQKFLQTVRPNSPPKQSDRTVRQNSPTKQSAQTVRPNSPTKQSDQTVRPSSPTKQSQQTVLPNSPTKLPPRSISSKNSEFLQPKICSTVFAPNGQKNCSPFFLLLPIAPRCVWFAHLFSCQTHLRSSKVVRA